MAKASPKHLMTTMAPAKSPAARRRFCTGDIMGRVQLEGVHATGERAKMFGARSKIIGGLDRPPLVGDRRLTMVLSLFAPVISLS